MSIEGGGGVLEEVGVRERERRRRREGARPASLFSGAACVSAGADPS